MAFAAMFDTKGNELWQRVLRHPSGGPSITTAVAFAPSGTPLVTGRGGQTCDSVSTPQNGGRGFIIRLDAAGEVLSRKQPARLIDVAGVAIQSGVIYLLGVRDVRLPAFEGVADVVVRLGAEDDVRWVRFLRGPRRTNAGAIAAGPVGGVVVAGSTDELPPPIIRGNDDAVAIGLAEGGAILWRWEMPDSPGYSHVTGIGAYNGDVIIGGIATGNVHGARPTRRGSAWVARLAVPR